MIFSYVEVGKLDDFSYYKEVQLNLETFISKNLYLNFLLFFLFSVVWISLLGFGSPILLISGILFGKWLGTIISVFSISTGSLILYSLAQFFFKDLVKDLLEKKFEKYILLFQKNEFFYLLIYRLVGGFGLPFFLQNLLPIVFSVKKNNYFLASFFGFIPGFFIFNSIGAGLNEFVKQSDSFSFFNLLFNKDIYLPIFLFVIVILISAIVKKKIFKNTSQ